MMQKIQTTKIFTDCQQAFDDPQITTLSEQGASRCFAAGTMIRMANGRLKPVEQIVKGDKVMSATGIGFNTVIETHHGEDMMYLVHQAKGIDYIVNSKHILTTKRANGRICEFETEQFAALDQDIQRKYFGYRSAEYDLPANALTPISVTPVGKGIYYGFTLDKSPYFLLSDGTVCHNSGKTWNTILWLIIHCLQAPKTTVSVVRQTFPALRRSVFRDFKDNMINLGIWNEKNLKMSEFIYQFDNGSWIEFFSADNEQKLRGSKRQILYVNEGNELSFIEWQQLQMRTTAFSIIDYNPSFTDEHWICELNKEPRTRHIISTYKENPFLEQKVIDEIESLKDKNPSLWRVYGLGLQAIIEGLIFENIEIVDEIPRHVKKKRFLGIDYGYTCFKGDTKILTAEGEKCISQVKEGDYVLTREGYRRVNKNLPKGRKKCLIKDIVINGEVKRFAATEEHLFNANGKWKKYGKLTRKDKLYVALTTTESSTGATRMGSTPTTTITSGSAKENTIANSSITQSGARTTAKSEKGTLYTTSTETRSTITFPTSWRLHQANTQRYTRSSKATLPLSMRELFALRKATGKSGGEKFYSIYRKNQGNVSGAEMTLPQPIHTKGGAQGDAIMNGNTNRQTISLKQPVSTAEQSFSTISTINKEPAQPSALINCYGVQEIVKIGEEWCEVYDLSIDGVHEYFANGILVHNCDPTACVEVCIYGDEIWLDEVCYATKMLTDDIIRTIKDRIAQEHYKYKVISESADPRLIDEIYNAGIDIHPVKKFGGSIMAGITAMLGLKIKVTRRSVNVNREFKNYTYRQDKEGKWLNEPIDTFNHCFVGKTLVGTAKGEKRIDQVQQGDMILTSAGYYPCTKVFNQGRKIVRDYELKCGKDIIVVTCTPNHKIKTSEGWKEIQDLQAGDKIYLYKSFKEKNLPQTSIQESYFAREVVLGSITQRHERIEQVYDIEVKEAHEFYANGLLVHNCIDAIRYVVLTEILGKNNNALSADDILGML